MAFNNRYALFAVLDEPTLTIAKEPLSKDKYPAYGIDSEAIKELS